ncbi:hypothetical protein N431DRAFT_505000 [Stipitochalara longipes BDJ]|nr:hypothetical protein N431DRAFT_505000 [Stipitochalara longipes BDJ]
MEAGLPPEIPAPPRQNPYEQPKSMPPANRSRPQMPPALAGTRNGQGPIGVAISRPTQVPQWPLAATIEGSPDQQYQPPAGRGAAPQRPPRPSHVPSMLDASRLQDHTPTFQYQPQNAQKGNMPEDEVTSPVVSMSSRPSTISSVGTIPDFPVPMPPPAMLGVPGSGPPRRSANLGPPPTSRRGNSSYYSQASYVSPIPEESPRTQPSHESYASSAAIPTSWGSDSPGFRFEDDDDEYEDDYRDSRDVRQWRNEPIQEEGRESRESTNDDEDDRGLIRSASVGKRAKPSMITTKSSDSVRPSPMPQQVSKLERMGVLAPAAGVAAAGLTASRTREGQRETVWPMVGNPDSPLASGTGLIDKSSSNSEESIPQVARAITTDELAPNYTTTSDPSANAMLGAYNAASGLAPRSVTPTRTPSPGFNRLSAVRRPPRLDMDAVRDAEARGSLTSLPDLIRRATRLAAMMDRGKRPASRLNDLNDFGSFFPTDSQMEKEKELELSPNGKRQSGLSGMLSAFPPPGLGTPTRGGTPNRPNSAWPTAYEDARDLDPTSRQQPPKRRRCCGLPVWGFFLVLLILLVIIAAAVVVPLELLVFHKPKTSSTTTASSLASCSTVTATACQNGGTSILDNGACACICTNGFTGPTCTVANFTGCATTTFSSGTYSNVTLGNAIPRLITDAQANFSIPLFESVILARFNAANLTCASENALVTFDGNAQRVGNSDDTALAQDAPTAATGQKMRRIQSYPSSSAASPTAAASSTSTTPTSYSATPTPTVNPYADFTITQQVLDFARVAVLFVLQQEDIDNAVTAQSELQHLFALNDLSNTVARNISIGGGNTVDLLRFSINLGNGTVGTLNNTVSRRAIMGRSANLWAVL